METKDSASLRGVDEKEAALCFVYEQLNEDNRQKMEELAVNLLNTQTAGDTEPSAVEKRKQESDRKQQ